ncbi:unnamed protein product [Clonostachys byssicola]|uniref:Sterigmatocystin biosynthesis monooxygenase stcW n=1 Tax=Clonostachys byssicola TaxID=160290 RepID=A0A9N9Y383_9HYPO|nr:unnamed protein product [Clonostachys byssicola]
MGVQYSREKPSLGVSSAPDIPIPDQPLGTAQKIRIICVGAGVSGLNLAHQVATRMKNVDFQIYEKNHDIGGTWLENKYPGCACDVPAHNYQYSWALNPNWSEFYPSSKEIHTYLKDTARNYDLEKFIKLHSKIISAIWDESTSLWNLKVEDQLTKKVTDDSCNYFINGGGFLNNWKWPDIPGLKSFKGDLAHTASWDETIDLKNKRVAVIGNGSTGIQVVATINEDVKHLTTLIRNPTWITPAFAEGLAGKDGANIKYTEQEKKNFAENPEKWLEYRKSIEAKISLEFTSNIMGTKEQKDAQTSATELMIKRLGNDPVLSKILIPDFGVGCRRPTPGLGYLESLVKPNVRLVTDHIEEVVPSGIKLKTGEIVEVDVLITATGFDYTWIPRFPIIGRNGINLQDQWQERPASYMGIGVNNMPNYFVYLGPNSPLSHGSVIPTVEVFTKYMLLMIWKAQTENYKSFVLKDDAYREYLDHHDTFHKRTVWGTKCRSWLKGGREDGHVLTHCGSRIHNIHMLWNPRAEDYEWQLVHSNRFSYLGNGYSVKENESEGRDVTWFLTNPNAGYEPIQY